VSAVWIPERKTGILPGMATLSRCLLAVGGLLAAGCVRNGVCPNIGCSPTIALTYDTPLAGPYTVSVVVHGMTFSSTCPPTANATSPGIARCDQLGLEISGVDLGHGGNQSVPVAVSIDGAPPIAVAAELGSIQNSRDCDVVCYEHAGVVKL
jgi:hypothetical protein